MMDEFTLVQGGHNGAPVRPIPTVVPTPTEYESAGKTGARALWVVFAIMVISSGVFALRSWNIPLQRRLYHVITTLITLTAALSYFAMATGDGNAYSCIKVKDHHSKHIPSTYHDECRQVFWVRYIDWSLTTPLLLLDLCLLAGISGAHTIMAIVADIIMVLTGMFAAFGREHTPQKWGWYAIGCIAYLFIIWHLAVNGRAAVAARGSKTTKLFASLSVFTLILWTAYPIVWGVADGARRVSVDTEIIIYAVLDILAKPVFGTWLLVAHRRLPEANAELGGYWAHGLTSEGRIRIGDEEDGN